MLLSASLLGMAGSQPGAWTALCSAAALALPAMEPEQLLVVRFCAEAHNSCEVLLFNLET